MEETMSRGLFSVLFITGIWLEAVILQLLRVLSLKRAVPENVADLYGRRSYARWKDCRRDLSLFSIFHFTFEYVVFTVFLLTDVHRVFARTGFFGSFLLRGAGSGLLAFYPLLIPACRIMIKNKYGQSQQDAGRYIRKGLLAFAASFVLCIILDVLITPRSANPSSGFTVTWPMMAVACLVFLSVRYRLRAARQYNSCVAVRDRDLSDRLHGLARQCGVDNIEFHEGLYDSGHMRATVYWLFHRNIVAFSPSLLRNLETDAVCAVAAHEIGHAGLRHLTHRILLIILCTCGTVFLVWSFFDLLPRIPFLPDLTWTFHEIIMLLEFFVVFPVCIMIKNRIFQLEELHADAYAVKAGFGKESVIALKRIEKETIAELNPHPLLQLLTSTHPSLTRRLDNIDNLLNTVDQSGTDSKAESFMIN